MDPSFDYTGSNMFDPFEGKRRKQQNQLAKVDSHKENPLRHTSLTDSEQHASRAPEVTDSATEDGRSDTPLSRSRTISIGSDDLFGDRPGLDDIKDGANSAAKFQQQFRSYELRPGAREDGKAIWLTTWLDTDTSGDYNPSKPDHKQEPEKGQPRPRLDTSDDEIEDQQEDEEKEEEPRAAYLSRLAARQTGASLVVTFDLTTTALQNVAERIPDNWPEEGHNILSDAHYELLAQQLNKQCNTISGYNLRAPRAKPDVGRDHEDADDLDKRFPCRIRDPRGEEVDLRNHPDARGCRECRMLGLECQMLRTPETWPCFNCVDAQCDCVLITTPIRKRQCLECAARKKSCSYTTENSDSTRSCTSCAETGHTCVAGPAMDSMPKRIAYDGDNMETSVERELIQCTECRRTGRRCSLKSKADPPPCKSCQKGNIACTFLKLPSKKKKVTYSPTTKKKVVPPDNETPGIVFKVKTKFKHPVKFLHEVESECDWCHGDRIGILGRIEREIDVILSEDGCSYQEVNSSCAESDHDKLCIKCTMTRTRITACEGHEMRPLKEFIPADDQDDPDYSQSKLAEIDLEGMFQRLVDLEPLSTDQWCDLCPGPATHSCCAPQPTDMYGDPLDPSSPEAEGCGLLLCDYCADTYSELEDLTGVMDEIEADVQRGGEEGGETWLLGLRADAEFLKIDGLLLKAVFGSGEESEEDAMDLDG